MSFERQDTKFTCGPASLRYALSLLGVGLHGNAEVTERALRLVIPDGFAWRRCQYGFDDSDLRFAAQRLGLKVRSHPYHRLNPDRFMRDLTQALTRGRVCLCTWHNNKTAHFHWVCVAGTPHGGRIIVFDPLALDADQPTALYNPVDETGRYAAATMSLKRFRKWITPRRGLDVDGEYHFFMDLHPAAERAHRFVSGRIDFALLRAMKRDFEICSRFDEYIDDLRTIFQPTARSGGPHDAHRFLVRHRGELERLVARWTLSATCPAAFYKREIASLIDILRCYHFRVLGNRPEARIADLSFYLAWRACEYTHRVGRYEET